ncbi:MAG: 30S ribosomal protein S16 [Actinomycetaceae bacterium]|nr:30S ribosomal protein S16 [Actinomycetaceae bacterium]
MAVRIRLKRIGKIHAPIYRVVVVDSRKKRDGRVIEQVGKYDALQQPSLIDIESERVAYWLSVGAQPSEQVMRLLKLTGDWARHKGVKDPVSRVQFKDADAAAKSKEEALKAAEAAAEKLKAAKAEEEAKAKAEAEAAAKEEAKAAEAAEAETAEVSDAAEQEAPAEEKVEASAEAPAEEPADEAAEAKAEDA